MSNSKPPTSFTGAMSLLHGCVGGQKGESLLIVGEPEGTGFYDDEAPKLTAAAARSIGMKVYRTESDAFLVGAEDIKTLYDTLRGFDHIIFFSRVGDQIRFADNNDMPSATMCYTLDQESLTSDFGTACYHGLCDIKASINKAVSAASHIHVSCPLGTDYSGKPDWCGESPVEVTIKRFPMLVPQPIPAMGFNGRIALSRFLVGTGSHMYEPYCLPLNETVFACVENNRITHFEGHEEEVERVNKHYLHVSSLLSIDPWCVDSWHAGIHPGCHFRADAATDIMRWSGTAFGNPRILHFHTCGNYAPGEISWNILDPTIYIDSVAVWESGRLYPNRLPDGEALLAKHPDLAMLYQDPYLDVGLRA